MPFIQDLMSQEVTRLVLCWRLIRRDGVILSFTAHNHDIFLEGEIYKSASSFVPSALVRSSGTDIDTIALSGALSHASLAESDLISGRYNGAKIFLFMIDWSDQEAGRIDLGSGILSNVSTEGSAFKVEVQGLTSSLDRSIVELVSPECRADLGDKRCRVALRRFTNRSTVLMSQNNEQFEADGLRHVDHAYNYGRIHWISGANSGLFSDVSETNIISSHAPGLARMEISLREAPPLSIQAGDIFEITFGCDKRFDTCVTRFNNRLNFRGEPFVPGIDALIRYPDAG